MTAVGTRAWAQKTGGRVGFLDRMELTVQAIRLRLLWRQRVGMTFPELALDDGDIKAPDSAVARRAIALVESLSDPFLVNHCLRSYYWGKLLAKAQGMRYDAELLFVSALLHDLGLTERHRNGSKDEHCFAVTGARHARKAMQAEGWSNRQLDAMEEAILLHLNILVPVRHGAEAHLLHAGAALDMIGARMDEIRGPAMPRVLELHPRENHKVGMANVVGYQCSIRPTSRIAFLESKGFGRMVRNAPFSS